MPRLPAKQKVLDKIKPAAGFSHLTHLLLRLFLPILAYVLVRANFVGLAILLIFISKWRMFAVKPRYWLANLSASGVDIIIVVSLVLFMSNTSVRWWQLFWTGLYIGWLLWLKPKSDPVFVSAQAFIGQLLGISILYLKFGNSPLAVLVAGTWVVAYLSARHFLTSFEESRTTLLANVWAYFAASLAFILGHWMLFYGSVPQILVILTTVGYGMAALYYLDATDRLTTNLQRQLIGIMGVILLIVLVLSDWTGATV